eukprot:TRINITY_DN11064_c0_g1_i1.p1 TRINITY_DN11064_c0_g1~~TRINITY_DN11064_c0_g1_i1.p1  ORF type:complete len:484 (-),score=73.80 TRINITY_DN11064_c0_g1_i1:666-2117(-)
MRRQCLLPARRVLRRFYCKRAIFPPRIIDFLNLNKPQANVTVRGWVKSVRHQKKISFIHLSDGSSTIPLQIVADNNMHLSSVLKSLNTGCSVSVNGDLVHSQGGASAQQNLEIHAKDLQVIGTCPSATYPLQKTKFELEYLREIPHLRTRTQFFQSLLRVRATAARSLRSVLDSYGFVEIHTPLLTSSDCEGAGETFQIRSSGKREFFDKEVFLTVSGQLQAEILATSMSRVYTFSPTFRADSSDTRHHLAEFTMLEPEMAFCDFHQNIAMAQEVIRAPIRDCLELCGPELDFFAQETNDEFLVERLEKMASPEKDFVVLEYSEAVKIIQTDFLNDQGSGMLGKRLEWGEDLGKEHEKYLTDKVFAAPVFVINYPADIKPFYMKRNDEKSDITVQAMDLLVPGIGEVIGGSVREEDEGKLMDAMTKNGMNVEQYQWYVDLRRFGTVPHAGFGLGFERFIQFLTSIKNIRDALPFPRWRGSCEL